MEKMIAILIGLTIVVGGALTAAGADLAEFGSFVTIVVGLFAVDQARKARTSADTAVQNTNGRMTELVAANAAHASAIDELRRALGAAVVPVEQLEQLEGVVDVGGARPGPLRAPGA